ncbi:MAG: hypothetical protein GX298_09130 [Planctomycetes bacterium]|nr:hypothetical protein [Planctomycetota bacterium]
MAAFHGIFRMADPPSVNSSEQAARAANRAERTERSVKRVEENLSKTLLICEALWELLSERTGLMLDDLHNKLYEIDMRDGSLDGKNQRKAIECSNCKRMVGPHHSVCFYCGQVIDDSVFRL